MTNQSIRELISTTDYNLYILIGKCFIIYISKSISKLESKYLYDILNLPVNYTRVEKQQNALIIELEDLN